MSTPLSARNGSNEVSDHERRLDGFGDEVDSDKNVGPDNQ
jgi:hypothetical protein